MEARCPTGIRFESTSTEISIDDRPSYISQWQREVNQHNRRSSTSSRTNEEVVEVAVVEEEGEVLVVEVVEAGDVVDSEVEVGIVELGMVVRVVEVVD